MQPLLQPDALEPPAANDAASVGGRDVTPYLAMLSRQLADNMAVSNRLALGLRWLVSPVTDSLTSGNWAAKPHGQRASAFILTGSRNHTALGGYAVDASIDLIRLELRAAGVTEFSACYSKALSSLPLLCASENFSEFVQAIRKRAADRKTDRTITLGGGFAQVLTHASQSLRLPQKLAERWFARQIRLLAASRLMFLELWKSGAPEVLLCHGGLNFVTSGAKLAALEHGIPAFEIQHGAINMLDPMRRNSPLQPYCDEQLLAWLRHGGSQGEIVLGPPQFRMHQLLTGDPAHHAGLIPKSLVTEYHSALAKAAHEKSRAGKPVALAALQKNGNETVLAKSQGIDLRRVQLWKRGHPAHRRQASAAAGFNASVLPLGALLSEADWLLTGHSSAAAEAAAFGCGVKFLSPDGALLYPGVESHAAEFSRFPDRPPAAGQPGSLGFGSWVTDLRANNWRAPNLPPD